MPTPPTTTRPRWRAQAGAGAGPLRTAALLAALLAWPAASPADPQPPARPLHRIGVLAHRPKPQVQASWWPLAAELERALPGHRFTVEAFDYPELDAAIAERRIDLVITNPGHFVGIRSRQPMSGALATVVEQGPGVPLAAFGGTIVVRSDRSGPGKLSGLADLAGARIACVGSTSLGGYQAQAFELSQAGVGPPAHGRLLLTGMPHDRVVEAVLSGQADAGFVRSGTLELMVAEGRLAWDQVAVLNRQAWPGFPYAVSTRLYPEWPVVALAHVEEADGRLIAAALLGLRHGARPGEGGYQGFAIPADYSAVETVLRALRLPPFEGLPAFGAGDVLRRYQWPAGLLALAAVVILVLGGFLVAANRRLARARREAGEAATTLAQVLATASVGITRVRDRRQLWANRHMEELVGASAAELQGVETRRFYPDEEAYDRIGREAQAALAEGRTFVTEQRLLRKDGSTFWARMRGTAVDRAGGLSDAIWTFEDVSERRQVEDALRQALAVNQATLDELRAAHSSVKQLSGLLPICMYCHKIRTDQGYWDRIEVFISSHSEANFSHGICPSCLDVKFPPAR